MRTRTLLLGVWVLGCGDDATTSGGGGTGATTGANATSASGQTSTSSAGTTASATTGSTGSSSSTGGGAPCEPPCGMGFDCCDGACVNQANDILNCGGCGVVCMQGQPFCDNGTCGDPPCDGQVCIGTTFCCGANCCDLGLLCCVVQQGGPTGAPECHAPTDEGTCPPGTPGGVCASPDTPIATPRGDRAIADLSPGDLVYSVHRGVVVAVPLLEARSTPVQRHHVVEVALEGGGTLRISPGHPSADGRSFERLAPGDALGDRTVRAVSLVPYAHPATHDILPDSDSGTYFAAGALIGSTLGPADPRWVAASMPCPSP